MNTIAHCVKTKSFSKNLEREYVIIELLPKQVTFFGIYNNGYKLK